MKRLLQNLINRSGYALIGAERYKRLTSKHLDLENANREQRRAISGLEFQLVSHERKLVEVLKTSEELQIEKKKTEDQISTLTASFQASLSNVRSFHHACFSGNPPDCKICGKKVSFFDAVDLGMAVTHGYKYPLGPSGELVKYWLCDGCGFIFSDSFDSWTKEDFLKNIYNSDYVKVDPDYVEKRPREMGQWVADLLKNSKGPLSILDYGAGSGVLINELGKVGLADTFAWDPFSNPERPSRTFDVIICFEVLEHVVDPKIAFDDFGCFLSDGGVVLISTHLNPENIASIGSDWWYLGPRNGHISLYSQEAMNLMAQRSGFVLSTNRKEFHMLRKKERSHSPVIDLLRKTYSWLI
jgi:hypothetical protein